ncbi:MAG: 1-acyl-sn-glycerol-3-phosphate acyltransferase, partial [Actinomycetota bacterium]
MAGVRDELKGMAKGFRWGRRPLVPRSAEPYVQERDDEGFPADWARSELGVAARQVILGIGLKPMLRAELALRVYGEDLLAEVRGP